MKGKRSGNNNNIKQNRSSKEHKDNNSNRSKMAGKRKPRIGNTKPFEKDPEKQITVRRSSGRNEKFDKNRMAQTVARSGVPFLMARNVAKKVSDKIKQETFETKNNDNKKSTQIKEETVTASKLRNLVANELHDTNRSDIAASYSNQSPENTMHEENLKDKQPIADTVAANRNRVLHDTSKRGGGIMT